MRQNSKNLPWSDIAQVAMISALVFTTLALFFTYRDYMIMSAARKNGLWALLLIRHFLRWLPVMLLAPAVFWLVRFVWPTPKSGKWLLVHVAASMVWVPLRSAFGVLALAIDVRFIYPVSSNIDYSRLFVRLLFSDYYWYWVLVVSAFAWHSFWDQDRR